MLRLLQLLLRRLRLLLQQLPRPLLLSAGVQRIVAYRLLILLTVGPASTDHFPSPGPDLRHKLGPQPAEAPFPGTAAPAPGDTLGECAQGGGRVRVKAPVAGEYERPVRNVLALEGSSMWFVFLDFALDHGLNAIIARAGRIGTSDADVERPEAMAQSTCENVGRAQLRSWHETHRLDLCSVVYATELFS